MESKIKQTEIQETEKPKIVFDKLKERYKQFVSNASTNQQISTKPVEPAKQTSIVQTLHLGPSDSTYTRDLNPKMLPFDKENLKKLSRSELKGPNYTLHILHYNEGVGEEKDRVKKLDDFKQLSTYFCLSCRKMIVERDMAKPNHYLSIGAYDYFFNIYTRPLEFGLYVKIDGKGMYINHIEELGIYFDIRGNVLGKNGPIKQNSVKVIVSYVPEYVRYEDEKGIFDLAINGTTFTAARLLNFRTNDPNKLIRKRGLKKSVDKIINNTILSNRYVLSSNIDKNSGQKDPFLKGLIDLAQNPTDPNTYSIIKPLFDKIEEKMVDIMLKKYQNYRRFNVGARILVFVIDPVKQDNIQIVVVPGYLSIQFIDRRYTTS
jgi:hypothetical protein